MAAFELVRVWVHCPLLQHIMSSETTTQRLPETQQSTTETYSAAAQHASMARPSGVCLWMRKLPCPACAVCIVHEDLPAAAIRMHV